MLCMLFALLCLSMVIGGQAFDWEEAVSAAYDERNDADSRQDINDMMNTFSDNITFYPSGGPPLIGKPAISDMYAQQLADGQWTQNRTLTFEKIIAKCQKFAVAEHTTKVVLPDGRIYKGSGVRVLIRDGDEIHVLISIWNSNGPLIDPNDS